MMDVWIIITDIIIPGHITFRQAHGYRSKQ